MILCIIELAIQKTREECEGETVENEGTAYGMGIEHGQEDERNRMKAEVEKMIEQKVKEKENLDKGIRATRKKGMKNKSRVLHNRIVRKRSRINTLLDVLALIDKLD